MCGGWGGRWERFSIIDLYQQNLPVSKGQGVYIRTKSGKEEGVRDVEWHQQTLLYTKDKKDMK